MNISRFLMGAALTGVSCVAVAQQSTTTTTTTAQGSVAPDPGTPVRPLNYDPGYDSSTPRSAAISAATRPETSAANGAVAAQGSAAATQQTQTSAADQAQYDRDMQAYAQQLRDDRHIEIANDMAYQHRQRAYADAMVAWRVQVAACHSGHTRACNAPTPDPRDFR